MAKTTLRILTTVALIQEVDLGSYPEGWTADQAHEYETTLPQGDRLEAVVSELMNGVETNYALAVAVDVITQQ